MNKPYFTRYLPIEGEIKEDDNFIINTYNSHQYGIKTALVVGDDIIRSKEGWPSTHPIDKKTCKKVKLFLCSRDIAIGDEVIARLGFLGRRYSSILNKTVETIDDSFLILEGNRVPKHEFKLKQEYKILGEISPDAVWVKEGDEFNEDEVKYWGNNNYKTHRFKNFKIKGLCGHFH